MATVVDKGLTWWMHIQGE